jgi:hypothetical protein
MNKPSSGFYSRAEMARILGTSVGNFDATYRRYAGTSDIEDIGGRPYFRASAIIRAWAAQVKPESGSVEDLLLAEDANSPALEEWRKGRARLVWMDVEDREKTHISKAKIEGPLMKFAGLIRRAGESLARKYGNDAAAQVNQAIDQWWELVQEMLKPDERGTDPVGADGGSREDAAVTNGS